MFYVVSTVAGQGFGMGGMGAPKPPKVPANTADLPFIRCQTCEALVKHALSAVKELRQAVKPGKPLVESDIIDALEQMCDPETDAGEWIRSFDLQPQGDQLKLVDMGQIGQCGVQCRTISKACREVTEDLDLSDMSEMLYKGTKRSALTSWACKEETSACKRKAPPLPAGREAGPAFTPMDEQAIKAERMMRKMKASGMKGTMYDRDALQQQMAMMQGGGEDDDDDEDDQGFGAGNIGMADLPGGLSGGEL